MGTGEFFELIGMLLTVVAILVLAYLVTRYMAKLKLGNFKTKRDGGHMKVIDQLTVGQDTRVMLVQVGERFLLLGISPGGVTQLSELSAEEAALWQSGPSTDDSQGTENPSFRDSFVTALKQRRK